MIALFCAVSVAFFQCDTGRTGDLQPVDLLPYGMPVTILAPDSPEIKKMDMVVQQDVTVKKGDDYYVQIFSSDAETRDMSVLLREQLDDVKGNPFFHRIVEEESDGFIYENKLDSLTSTYGFRYVRLIGDKQYIFQTGLIGTFTEDEVRRMYEAVQYREED